ncbi:MAG: hypothetical protein ACRDSP_26985 [Pseudonocardiaceae bacterium]
MITTLPPNTNTSISIALTPTGKSTVSSKVTVMIPRTAITASFAGLPIPAALADLLTGAQE